WQTLKIYNVLGNEIATLVNEYRPAGNYDIEFSISDEQLSSGVYFYQLKTDNYVQSRKMVLIK
ncbi:MAG: T9SS type A sorting domain-containing protein, partial [Ignavibacterium sp.]|nr:T9SS type A sorting domain-containing protein [Ignavibacterium sp.]